MTAAARVAAVVGCGRAKEGKVGWAIGHAHAEGWRVADPAIRLVGVDPSAENLVAFGRAFGLAADDLFPSTEAMYASVAPDFVSVCTWVGLHAALVMEAAGRGVRGIVCEKPMASDVGEIRRMVAACEEAGARLAIAHQRRYDPVFAAARELIRKGAIGDGLSLEARVADDWDMLEWTVHWFDMASYLFDAGPLSVLAGIAHTGQRRYDHAVEDRSIAFLEYPGGRQAVFISGPQNPTRDDIVIRGSGGVLRIGSSLALLTDRGATIQPVDAPRISAFGSLMTDVLRVAGTADPMACGVEACAIATEVAFAAHESARTMRTVTLPLTTQFAPLEIVQTQPRLDLPDGRIVVLADNHYGSGGPEGLVETLETLTGRRPDVLEATGSLAPPNLADAAVVLLYHTQATRDPETEATLTAWVEAGRPLLLVHGALGAWPAWEAYGRWACRIWVWGDGGSEHAMEPAELRVVPNRDFGTPWAVASLPRDEVYIHLAPTAEAHDLVTASNSEGTVPAAWTAVEHPNVGAWAPGHRRDSWGVPAMRDGLAHLMRACLAGTRRPGSPRRAGPTQYTTHLMSEAPPFCRAADRESCRPGGGLLS